MASRHVEPSVPSATSLPANPREDYDARVRHYLISMTIRTVCFVAAFFTEGIVRWTCVGLAVILPYIAVVFANASEQRRRPVRGTVAPTAQQEWLTGSDTDPAETHRPESR